MRCEGRDAVGHSFYGHECAVSFHSAISSGFASAGPKSDLELVPLDLAPEKHILTTSNDSKSAEICLTDTKQP